MLQQENRDIIMMINNEWCKILLMEFVINASLQLTYSHEYAQQAYN